MRRYETIFIVTPDCPEEDLKTVATKFQGLVTSMDWFVSSYEEQGKKRLAYNVKKKDKGYYVLMDYVGSSDLVSEIERTMRLDDRILKYLTVKLADKVDPESIKEQELEPQEAEEPAEADEAEELLQELQQNNFRLGVISNRSEPFDEQLESLGLSSYFEFSLAAGTIDAWKPDPLIFQHALTQMKINPEQAVYIGDNYFADVVGARNAGIKPVLIDPANLFPEADCLVIESLGDLEIISAD